MKTKGMKAKKVKSILRAYDEFYGVLGVESYLRTTLGEISSPSASCEVLAPFKEGGTEGTRPNAVGGLEGVQEPVLDIVPEGPKLSPWRPDNVRVGRKMKQHAEYRLRRKKKGGRPIVYKGWKAKRKRAAERSWNSYQRCIAGDPWRKYRALWQSKKYKVEIDREEFLKFISSLGGLMEVDAIWVWDKTVKWENLLVYRSKDRASVTYRGTNVPEYWGRDCPRPKLPKATP